MHLLFIKYLFSNEIIQALCWTLIHSLWQGVLMAVAGGLIMMATKKSPAALRYNLLSILFFLFIVVACFTFARQLNYTRQASPVVADQSQNIIHADGMIVVSGHVSNAESDYISSVVSYLSVHASLIVTIWFIIFSAQFVRLLANVGYVQRIRHYKTHSPSVFWREKISELAQRLQISYPVMLLESEIVKVPTAAGLLKPVILFPFSLLYQLPQQQVEAVLLHELAHIRRKDYLVNFLQNFAEIIFFFNPAALWISSLIRDERENCCDDIAIYAMDDKERFVQALVAFQEYNLSASNYRIAFPGQKNHLLNRVKRIISNQNKTLNNMEKIFLATSIIVAGFIAMAFTQRKPSNPERINSIELTSPHDITLNEKSAEQVESVARDADATSDTIPSQETLNPDNSSVTVSSVINGRRYKIIKTDGKVTGLFVDGKRVPANKIKEYEPIIAEMDMRMRRATADWQKTMNDKRDSLILARDELKQKFTELEKTGKPLIVKSDAGYANTVKPFKQMEPLSSIIKELMDEKIIDDDINLTITLDKDQFVVNNIKQSEELHQQYYERYLKNNPENHIIFSCTEHSAHSDVMIK